ncbi:MAG: hypothetical protein ACR2FO_09325 [Actinomycetota bacterium]
MAKTAKKPPPRKPVRARGAIPVPKTAPPRSRSAWYHRSGYQLIAIAVGIALIGTVLKVGGDWLRTRKETKVNTQAVRKFDRKYQLAKSPLGEVLSSMAAAPDGVTSGKLPPPELKKQADLWLTEFRKLDTQLRSTDIPPGLPELDETRALLVQGNIVLIDSVKSLQLGATTPDTATRDLALKQSLNIAAHGQNLVTSGETKLTALKVRFGVGKRPATPDGAAESSPAPIQLPSEEAPTAPAGGQPGQAGAVPDQATTTLPVQPAP